MTRFIDVSAVSRLVGKTGVETFFRGMVDFIEADYRRWEAFDKCARVANHSEIGVIELMPVADQAQYGFKYVNGHPSNTARGLPTVMAFGALSDVETGYPTLLSELTLTTAFRTAATSVFAARQLARPQSRSMAMIGNGAQSEFQAIAFHTVFGIDELRIFDVDKNATDKLARHLMAFPNLKVIKSESASAACEGADIVTTVTADKRWATILTADMVEAGMHINAVGGDCPGKTELAKDVLDLSSIFVEFEPQSRVEGDIQQLPADHRVTEIWRVLKGLEAGRESDSEITVFDSVGFALEDFSALRYLNHLAELHSEGETIELVPTLDDPKDLFSLTVPAAAALEQKAA
ncbi:MAG: ornithine cyclodeaminase [Pseudomonadota bacterium]